MTPGHRIARVVDEPLSVAEHEDAVADKAAARDLEQYFSEIVVVRGTDARPPSELLALTMPGRPAGAPEAPLPAPMQAPNLLAPRGPEISEVR